MHHKVHQQKNTTSLLLGGFGLIELMVTISILILVMGIILTKHSSFNSAVLLRGQTFDVALEARQIQLTAVSVISDSTNYRNVYGLYFDTTNIANESVYKIFKDADGDHFFDAGEEYGKQGKLDPRYKISYIKVISSGEVLIPDLSITFTRPNFDPMFYVDPNSITNPSLVEIGICLKNTACTETNVGEVRVVEITRTGQISVKN